MRAERWEAAICHLGKRGIHGAPKNATAGMPNRLSLGEERGASEPAHTWPRRGERAGRGAAPEAGLEQVRERGVRLRLAKGVDGREGVPVLQRVPTGRVSKLRGRADRQDPSCGALLRRRPRKHTRSSPSGQTCGQTWRGLPGNLGYSHLIKPFRSDMAVRSRPCTWSVASSKPPGMMPTLRPSAIRRVRFCRVADSSRPETSQSTWWVGVGVGGERVAAEAAGPGLPRRRRRRCGSSLRAAKEWRSEARRSTEGKVAKPEGAPAPAAATKAGPGGGRVVGRGQRAQRADRRSARRPCFAGYSSWSRGGTVRSERGPKTLGVRLGRESASTTYSAP